MILKKEYICELNIQSGRVEVTDPCYDKDVWCRTSVDVKPGKYKGYVYSGKDKDFGERQWIIQIVFADAPENSYAEEKSNENGSWKKVAEIGVDAGLAGFFVNKPDFSEEEWSSLCDWMFSSEKDKDAYVKHFDEGEGFWCSSGIGDGFYDVMALYHHNDIVALEIRF